MRISFELPTLQNKVGNLEKRVGVAQKAST